MENDKHISALKSKLTEIETKLKEEDNKGKELEIKYETLVSEIEAQLERVEEGENIKKPSYENLDQAIERCDNKKGHLKEIEDEINNLNKSIDLELTCQENSRKISEAIGINYDEIKDKDKDIDLNTIKISKFPETRLHLLKLVTEYLEIENNKLKEKIASKE
ncbi:hypothetical protein K502DRAFT_342604 [Neoconidiobolus thromboides FSU 785]|nr:hypothetical protein K502DRAFT_342604 [Neoconidiobolus thromboides FSU 785]